MKKKWLFFITIIIAVFAVVMIYFKTRGNKDFGPIVKTKLQQLVTDGSNGLYHLQLDSVHIDLVKGQIRLSNIILMVDSSRLKELDSMKHAPNDIFNIQLKALTVSGIGPGDILDKKNIDLNDIIIEHPVVEFFHHKRDYNYTEPDSINLYRRIQKSIGHFSLNDLQLNEVSFSYHNFANKNIVTRFKDISISLKNILIDSSTQYDSNRFLYAKDALIFLRDYNITMSDNLYAFHFDSAILNASSGEVNLKELSIKPKGNKNDFSKKVNYYTDRYEVNISDASIKNMDWYRLLNGEGFTAQQIKLSNGIVEVFADRTLPPFPKSKVGNYPQQLLMKINMPVYIPKIETDNIKVVYKELNPKSKKTGELVFDNINGAFKNVTNQKAMFRKNNILELNARASFMDAAPMQAIFKFNLSESDKGAFSVDAQIDSLDARKLTNTTAALGLFEINSARINKLIAHINGNNYQAKGTLQLIYDSLKITALKPEDKTGNLKKRGFISFIANNIILQESNTVKDDNADLKKINYQRDIHKSFFNLIWKTMLDGIKKTVQGKD